MTIERTLIDTAHSFDAGLMGLDSPCEYHEADGLRITQETDGWVTINGPDGEIKVAPAALAMVAHAINSAKSFNASRGI